ncbi:PID-CTERM protein-sorting domain-containing protein [Polaribacter sp.]|uniref:PID-CTERM protein-sorting domain-containing protein n=1 Tax=Polaribacter sp. TaxID=1920175 RepID=UPI003F6A637E
MSLKKILLVFVLLMVPFLGNTQVLPPPIPPPPPPGLPIDGLTGLLFLVGLLYGSKKIYKDSSN